MKLKVCGMKGNIAEVAALRPDYLGFIFWEQSGRYFDGEIPQLSTEIKKIGVFVNAPIEEILAKIEKYDLQGVQLHGGESPEFCKELKSILNRNQEVSNTVIKPSASDISNATSKPKSGIHVTPKIKSVIHDTPKFPEIEIIKVFSIKDGFDFSALEPYEECCDYYLFDTKGKLPGGNGYTFDWKVLESYPSTKPYFLSGGIGPENVQAIKKFKSRPEAEYCYALDVNSRFEFEPGLKNSKKLKKFKSEVFTSA